MPKKTKASKHAPKKYEVMVSKHGPDFSVTVVQNDPSLPYYSDRVTMSISGLTSANKHNDVALFNMMHHAIAHVTGARYPVEVEDVLEYADKFYYDLDLDVSGGVQSGDVISFEISDWNFESSLPSSEKTRKHATGDKQIYRYELFGEEGERQSQHARKKKEEKLIRPPVILD